MSLRRRRRYGESSHHSPSARVLGAIYYRPINKFRSKISGVAHRVIDSEEISRLLENYLIVKVSRNTKQKLVSITWMCSERI